MDTIPEISRRTTLTLPAISVVIPLYNGSETIYEALGSVLAQIRQPDEVIVVDDGSVDGGADIAAGFADRLPLRLLRQENAGQSAARNLAVRHARGELVAFLDQDDSWYPSHLAQLAEPFREPRNKPLGWTYSNLDEVDRNGALVASAVLDRSDTEHPKTSLTEALRADMFILPSATMVSRAAFEAVGGFDERLRGYEDDDLFIRLLRGGYDNVYVPEALSRWRIHHDSASFSPRMAASRMIFARKLIEAFPNDPGNNRFPVTDLLIPRFRYHVTENLRRALHGSMLALAERCAADLQELDEQAGRNGKATACQENLLLSVVMMAEGDAGRDERTLRSLLAQTRRPDEIIIVERTPGGGGGLPAGTADPRVRRVAATGAGATRLGGRNAGLRQSHGDLIAFVESGTDWYPDHLEELARRFQGADGARLGWVHGDFDEVDEHGRVQTSLALGRADALCACASLAECMAADPKAVRVAEPLLSRRAVMRVGGFDESLGAYAPLDLLIRLLHAGFEQKVVERALSRRPAPAIGPDPAEPPPPGRAFAEKLFATAAGPDKDTRRMIAAALVKDVLASMRLALRLRDTERAGAGRQALAWFDQWLLRGPDDVVANRPPLISVVIPLYNGGLYINEAIDSVFAQTRPPDEVIVVDDGSSDNGPDLVQERARTLPIRLIRQPNAGQSAARNAGVEHAHGDLLAFLDQDDAWYPTHLEELSKPFREVEHRRLGWSYSDIDEVDEAGNMVCRGLIRSHHKTKHPKLDLVNCLRDDMFILPSASLVARSAFQKIGGFNERLSGYEDDDLFLRLFRAGFACEFLPVSLSKWRIYQKSGSYSPRMAASRLVYARLLMERFPNDPSRSQYYVRDLIAPRFLRSMSVDFRRCVLIGDTRQQRVLLGHLAFIVRHQRLRLRMPMQFVAVPMLHMPLFARWAAQRRLPMLRRFRSVF